MGSSSGLLHRIQYGDPKLIPIITYSVNLFGSLSGNILLSETIVGHRAIADAIRTHNPEQAEKTMRLHIEQNQEELEAITVFFIPLSLY